jgi:ABC-type phosphate/phosphonate transport system substrate-binding protein
MKKMGVFSLVVGWMALTGPVFAGEALNCWFSPGAKDNVAKAITDALSSNSGLTIVPKIAKDYPEILDAFSTGKPQLVYVGSFVQAVINARQLGTPLVQSANGKEMYSGILIYPAGQEPEVLLRESGAQIAYAVGASSGESTAKAVTAGKAAVGVSNHGEAVKAVQAGKAKAAVVKDWWWLANESKYSGLKSYRIPGFSEQRNPDNVLTVSKSVSADDVDKLTMAALSSSSAFGDNVVVVPFEASQLAFSLELMKKGKIDPLTYKW